MQAIAKIPPWFDDFLDIAEREIVLKILKDKKDN
jgi:hypothetical protein